MDLERSNFRDWDRHPALLSAQVETAASQEQAPEQTEREGALPQRREDQPTQPAEETEPDRK